MGDLNSIVIPTFRILTKISSEKSNHPHLPGKIWRNIPYGTNNLIGGISPVFLDLPSFEKMLLPISWRQPSIRGPVSSNLFEARSSNIGSRSRIPQFGLVLHFQTASNQSLSTPNFISTDALFQKCSDLSVSSADEPSLISASRDKISLASAMLFWRENACYRGLKEKTASQMCARASGSKTHSNRPPCLIMYILTTLEFPNHTMTFIY